MIKRILTGIACVITILGSHAVVCGDVFDRDTVRKSLKSSWDSISTLDLECVTYPIDSQGVRIPKPGFQAFRLVRASGARMALTNLSVKADGERRILDEFRENGRRRYILGYIDGRSDWLSQINIQSQFNDDSHYQGSFNCLIWLLMPGGKPAFEHLGSESTLETSSKSGKNRLLISTTHRAMKLRIYLDPDHDYLASRIELEPAGREATFWEASRFEQDNGRWYPAEGSYLQASETTPYPYGFKITSCAINRPIEDSTFEQPSLMEGCYVHDEIARKQAIKGGPAARERLTKRYREAFKLPTSKSTQGSGREQAPTPIVASRTRTSIPWPAIIASLSIVGLLVAGGIYWRNHHQS